MLKTALPTLCVLSALLLLGCSKTDTMNNSNSGMTASSPATTNAPANMASNRNTPAKTAAGEKIGVAECDAFLEKYDACVTGHVPDSARAQYSTMLKQWRDSWRQLAANPQTKASLAQACKQAADQARTSMKTYNCTF